MSSFLSSQSCVKRIILCSFLSGALFKPKHLQNGVHTSALEACQNQWILLPEWGAYLCLSSEVLSYSTKCLPDPSRSRISTTTWVPTKCSDMLQNRFYYTCVFIGGLKAPAFHSGSGNEDKSSVLAIPGDFPLKT